MHSVLAFYYNDHPVETAQAWQNFSRKQEYVADYHKNNIKIMVSVGGGSVKPTSAKWDPEASAKNVAQFAKQYLLDGVDLDWEVCCDHKSIIILMHSFLCRILMR